MAFGVKYRAEFNDTHGITWKIDISKNGYSSGVNTVKCAGDPLKFEFLSDSDDFNDPIRETLANIKLVSETHFALSELYATGDLDWKVEIYHNSSLYWQGWITPGDYEEPYDDVPYSVEIKATDGLSYLKEYLFCQTESETGNTYYTGRMLNSSAVLVCLGKIGFTEFKEYVNIYETHISSSSSDSPFDQIEIDADNFKDATCYDVLKEIVKTFDSYIRQRNGIFEIVRPVELKGSTVYGRYFTGAATKTSVTYTPLQYFNSLSSASNLVQVPGGVLMPQSTIMSVTVNHNYGFKESWIDSWQFNPDDYITSTGMFNGWQAAGSCVVRLPSYYSVGESQGMLVDSHNTSPSLTKYVYQYVGHYLKSTSDVLNFSLEYMLYNSGSPETGAHFYVEIQCGSEYLYIYDDEFMGWSFSSSDRIDLYTASVPTGNSGWTTLDRKINGLPSAGPLLVKIYGMWDSIPNIYPIIRNIKIYSTSDTVQALASGKIKYWKKLPNPFNFDHSGPSWADKFSIPLALDQVIMNKTYVGINYNTVGKKIELNYSIGDIQNPSLDNVVEQFSGALAYVSSRDTLAQTATDFDTGHSADYSAPADPNKVDVTTSTNNVIFTAHTPGTDFTGATSITNKLGDLSGIVTTTQPNTTGRAQIDEVLITGGSYGSIQITANGVTRTCNWNTSIHNTVHVFATNAANIAAFAGVGLTLGENDTVPSDGITLTSAVGTAYSFTTTVTPVSTDITYMLSSPFQSALDSQSRIDNIALTGATGKADITCNGITCEIDVDETLDATTVWNTYPVIGGVRASAGDNAYLLGIIKDEIKAQGARGKVFLQSMFYEDNSQGNDTTVNINGQFQDNLLQYGGSNRHLSCVAGEFEVKPRNWQLDLIEII